MGAGAGVSATGSVTATGTGGLSGATTSAAGGTAAGAAATAGAGAPAGGRVQIQPPRARTVTAARAIPAYSGVRLSGLRAATTAVAGTVTGSGAAATGFAGAVAAVGAGRPLPDARVAGAGQLQLGQKLLNPGSLLADPVTAISLGLGLMFGTAGLPHILMRFFTVTDAKEARKSVLYASGIVAYFFNVIAIMGLCAIIIVGQNPQFFEGGVIGGKVIGGGNMIAMHLANAVGGNLLLGFLSAVAFATILAVVAGLALAGASAISHDIYSRVIMKGKANEATELKVSKFATIGLGVVAVLLGMAFEKMNIAFMVALAFGVAASANFPVLILSMYWKGLTTKGALVGGYSGLVSAVLFVLLSKSVWVDVLGNASAIFPYTQPALFSMPIAFFMTWLFSTLDSSKAAVAEKEAFEDQYVRAQTGVGAATASSH